MSKILLSLAFVPTVDVLSTFENFTVPSLLSVAGVEAEPFINYMRNTYIGDFSKEAVYAINEWNMSDEVFFGCSTGDK